MTLYRIAKSMTLNEKDCEDVVQNAILKSFQKLDTLKQEQFFKTWLVRILINECYSFKRKSVPTIGYEDYLETEDVKDDFMVTDSLEQMEKKDDYQALYGAIARLKPRVRMAVILYYIEEYSVEEVKDILKIPTGTVKSRLSKGRKELKAFLEKQE